MLEIIKKLRQMTGAGLADCKKAVEHAKGDMDDAKVWLRQNVASLATKKMSGREALQGVVAVSKVASGYSMVEITSETDFVARNKMFQEFAAHCVKNNKWNKAEELEAHTLESGELIRDLLYNTSGIIGEKMGINKCIFVEGQDNVYTYVHNKYPSQDCAVEMGKIGVIVKMSKAIDPSVGHSLAMHISAYSPEYIKAEDVPQTILDKEREIISNTEDFRSKPDDKKPFILEGGVRKLANSLALNPQPWILDGKLTVKDILKAEGAEVDTFFMFKVAG